MLNGQSGKTERKGPALRSNREKRNEKDRPSVPKTAKHSAAYGWRNSCGRGKQLILKTEMNKRIMIRRRIVFYGQVQGVGFRYRAAKAAEMVGCTGWVRNDWDGTVTMEIQGTEEQIDQVILAIERGRFIRIENMDSKSLPVKPEERRFREEE